MQSDEHDYIYFNFPIQLLKGFMEDSSQCLNDVINYCVYAEAQEYEGKIDERFEKSRADLMVNYGTKRNWERGKSRGFQLWSSIPIKSPRTGMHSELLWDFFSNNKSEFEKVCLLSFLAFKSILGNSLSTKTNNKLWFSRMDGNVSNVEAYELPDSIRKYHTRRYQTKIKTALENSWNLKEYSFHTTGFWISFKVDIETLVFHAEQKREETKEKVKLRAKLKKDARNKFKNRDP